MSEVRSDAANNYFQNRKGVVVPTVVSITPYMNKANH